MSYKLEFSDSSAFADILMSTIQMWCTQEPDVYLTSREGLKIYSQKVLLSFYSPMLRDILSNINIDAMVGISVPAKTEDISMLLKVLETGLVVSKNKDAFLEVGDVANMLGIAFNSGGSDVNTEERDEFHAYGNNPLEVQHDMDEMSQFHQQEMEEEAPLEIKHEIEESGEEYNFGISDTNTSKYNCKECGKHFVQFEKFNRHMSVHTSFACQMCGKQFKHEKRLKTHMMKLHGFGNGEVNAVQYLNAIFDSSKENHCVDPLINNSEVHDYDASDFDPASIVVEEERKYKCDECPATFKKNAHRERHMLIHTGERPFTCEICWKSFSRKDKLQKHSRTHGSFVGHEINSHDNVVDPEVNSQDKFVNHEVNHEVNAHDNVVEPEVNPPDDLVYEMDSQNKSVDHDEVNFVDQQSTC